MPGWARFNSGVSCVKEPLTTDVRREYTSVSKATVPQVYRPLLQLADCLVVIDSVIQWYMACSTSSCPSHQEVDGPLATELTTVTCTVAADTEAVTPTSAPLPMDNVRYFY